jgi:UDP-N-acetyl-2-amino-2-deoxyglucuronate dehydrogenase
MDYRFAIIGCGQIGNRHARQIARYGTLQSVCDIVPSRAQELATAYGAIPWDSPEQLLKNEMPDVVSVCTPNGLHAAHAIMALEAGCHVLCEKPMSLSTASGLQMIAAAEKAGKKLYVVKQNRYNPPVEAVKKLLEEGRLGRIHSFQVNCFWNRPAAYYTDSWHGTRDLDGGILFTQFSHFIDLLYWLLGDMTTVQGLRANYIHGDAIDFEDTGVALLQLQNGAMGSLHYTVNSYQRNMEGSVTIFGDRGTVKIGGQYLNKLEHFSVEGETAPELATGGDANQYGFYQGSMSNHDKVYEHLIKALNDPTYRFVEAREALKTVEIIEKIYGASPLMANS